MLLSLWTFVGLPLLGAAAGVVLGGVLCVVAVQTIWDTRLVAAFEWLLGDGSPGDVPPDGVAGAHLVRRRISYHVLFRILALLLGLLVLGLLVGRIAGLGSLGQWAFVSAGTVAGILVELWRPVALEELLNERMSRLGEPEQRSRWARQTLGWRLQWAGVATGAAGIAGVALFVHEFIPLPRAVRQLVIAVFPFTMAVVALVWWGLARRAIRSVVGFVSAADGGWTDGGDKAVEMAERVFRSAQVLPYALAGLKVGAFGVSALLLYFEGSGVLGADRDAAGLMASATVLVSFASALYETFWHRAALREVLTDLATRFRLDVKAIRSPLSLRVKMFFGFGLVLLFACAISIFWSFVQVKNLAVTFVQKQSRLKAEGILERVRTQDKLRGPLRPEDVTGILTQISQAGEEVYWYLPPTGPPQGFSGVRPTAPRLPFVARTLMRRQSSGVLRLGDLGLAGAYLRVRVGRRDLGSVAVLYPDQRRESTAPGPHTPVLAVFFVVVLLLSTGIVALIASDLSAPLQALERRAEEMAQGDLRHPVAIGAEADEVGRLAFALDAMRKSLEAQLRRVEELNVGLEEKVAKRTNDLGRANADLREALERLTRTQDQLVQSEKLASMGQLVAGVAHELNNPISAVGNTLAPLEQIVSDLVEEGPSDAPPADSRSTKRLEDVRSMLRIIRNGTGRIQRIVAGLSSYARPAREPDAAVDLTAVIDETLEIAAHLLSDVRVERDPDPARDPDRVEALTVKGDPGELGQVLMNLVANAAQAMAESTTRRLRLSVERQEGGVLLNVEDSGPGIDPEIRSRLFDPFFTTKPVGQGTGLGLSLCREIVLRHGGRIEVDDAPLGGARFRVWLPASDPLV